MATYTIEEIGQIIKTNPNGKKLEQARKESALYCTHVLGYGAKNSIEQFEYFENNDIYNAMKKGAMSNKDLFERLLQEERQVFTTRGGLSVYNLEDKDEQQFNGVLSSIRFGISLRKWIEKVAYEARKVDPMGVIFIETEESPKQNIGSEDVTPRCYPTYKSTQHIYDMLPVGRKLEYVCFGIPTKDYEFYGINDTHETETAATLKVSSHSKYKYYRWVDDSQDAIIQQTGDVCIYANTTGQNVIKNIWGRVPAFIMSDLMAFDDPQYFLSPISTVIELADSYLNDRADRNLQKKMHGFAKAIEPLLKCNTCNGTGYVETDPCPSCSTKGDKKGSGYKIITKPSDVSKFPLDILKDIPNFDFTKLFGYIAPPIETWDKQDRSLSDIESLMYYTYWSVVNTKMTGFNGSNKEETATKTLTDLQPKYARLNSTADWAESTENTIVDFVGQYYYQKSWRGANITYGRNYILETLSDLAQAYYEMKAKGAEDSLKDEALERYIKALYQNNHIQQAKHLKLMKVIPFPHNTADEIERSQLVPIIDKIMKRYGGEWADTLDDGYISLPENTVVKLRGELQTYAQLKLKSIETNNLLTKAENNDSKENN